MEPTFIRINRVAPDGQYIEPNAWCLKTPNGDVIVSRRAREPFHTFRQRVAELATAAGATVVHMHDTGEKVHRFPIIPGGKYPK